MSSTNELICSLPPYLVYLGQKYYLSWNVSKYDTRCVVLNYKNAYNEVLSIGNDYFYVETEKHYAVFTMLQCILYHAPHVLKHVLRNSPEIYNTIVEKMYGNSLILQKYCSVNPPEFKEITYETEDYIICE